MVVRATPQGTPRGTPQGPPVVTAGSAGLTPQMSIVNPDRTPTTFFFRWLLDARGGGGKNQTPWLSDIDAAGFSLVNLGGITGNGNLTIDAGTDAGGNAGALSLAAGGKTRVSIDAAGHVEIFPPDDSAPALRLGGPLEFPDGTIQSTAGGGGTGAGSVTSVGLSMPAEFIVAGSPVTSAGVLAVTKANQPPNMVYASPSGGITGPPAFRALTPADIPTGAGSGMITETPAGAVDGANTVFTLTSAPIGGVLVLFLNGVEQQAGVDYTLSGKTITYALAPAAGDWQSAVYGAVGSTLTSETPQGALNGSNTVFALSRPAAGVLMLFLNGVEQQVGVDYTLAGQSITYAVAPLAGDWHTAVYT